MTTSNARTKPTVVVVNDDIMQLQYLSRLLERQGMTVLSFESAEAALGAMADAPVADLIVTDLHMPRIDGWRFCRLLRSPEYERYNAVPILVVSATFAGDNARQITRELGADAFLAAPIQPDQLLAQVDALLAGQEATPRPVVLVADADKHCAAAVADAFAAHGYQTAVVGSAAAARDTFHDRLPDVVIVADRLPDGSGEALMRDLRRVHPSAVFLLTTRDPSPALAARSLRDGASAYVRKPYGTDYILALADNARRANALLRVEDLLEERSQELRLSEERHRLAVELTNGIVYDHDLEHEDIRWQGAVARLIGYREEELRSHGEQVWELLVAAPDRERVRREREACLAACRPYDVQYTCVRQDGTTFPVIDHGRPVLDSRGHASRYLGLILDVTERERLAEQLQEAERLRTLGQLAGGIAHDVNNQLAGIVGFADLLRRKLGTQPALQAHAAAILTAAERVAGLTEKLLAFAQRGAFCPAPVAVGDLIGRTIEYVQRAARNVRTAQLLRPRQATVSGDAAQLGAAFLSIARNAVEAMPDGGTLSITTRVVSGRDLDGGDPARDYLAVAFSDTGCGMSAEVRQRAVEPFFTTRDPAAGGGLGLSAVHGTVSRHGGILTLVSEPGQGTTVTIALPLGDGH